MDVTCTLGLHKDNVDNATVRQRRLLYVTTHWLHNWKNGKTVLKNYLLSTEGVHVLDRTGSVLLQHEQFLSLVKCMAVIMKTLLMSFSVIEEFWNGRLAVEWHSKEASMIWLYFLKPYKETCVSWALQVVQNLSRPSSQQSCLWAEFLSSTVH